MKLVALTSVPNGDWLRLRKALWPEGSDAGFEEEMAGFVAAPDRYGQFLATADDGTPIGLAEVSLRHDYVNGTETSPVAFLAGLYVAPRARRQGVAEPCCSPSAPGLRPAAARNWPRTPNSGTL